MLKIKYLLFSALCCLSVATAAQSPVRFHNEAADTARITGLLNMAVGIKDSGERIAVIGQQFVDVPYVAHTLEGESEQLTVNLDELDCTTFVETVMALAYTAGEGRTSWRDFVYNLQRLRYRGGNVDGYASRLHYICDWVIDNVHRGNFRDVTGTFPAYSYVVRTINFMSENRDKYPALADSAQYARIKSVELGYNNHRFPYVKSSALGEKATRNAFHNGDVVALVSKMKNLDVTHMGIIIMQEGVPYLLHASQSGGRVELSRLPLAEFMKKNTGLMGVRVFRL